MFFLKAVRGGAELVCFPETFNFLSGNSKLILENAETMDGGTINTLREWAVEYRVWIMCGSLFLHAGSGKINKDKVKRGLS